MEKKKQIHEKEIQVTDERGALTREFLLSRGKCCHSGCLNCPYPHRWWEEDWFKEWEKLSERK